jgi:hypothetical protein
VPLIYLPKAYTDSRPHRVPLDYLNTTKGNASLAVARFVVADRKNRLGTIFFNPGGPGGSGVLAMLALGASLARIAGGRYDFVGAQKID